MKRTRKSSSGMVRRGVSRCALSTLLFKRLQNPRPIKLLSAPGNGSARSGPAARSTFFDHRPVAGNGNAFGLGYPVRGFSSPARDSAVDGRNCSSSTIRNRRLFRSAGLFPMGLNDNSAMRARLAFPPAFRSFRRHFARLSHHDAARNNFTGGQGRYPD